MSDRLRVVQFIYSLDFSHHGGGADYYGARLALGLDPTQFESQVWVLWQCDTAAERAWQQRLQQAGAGVQFLAAGAGGVGWRQRNQARRTFQHSWRTQAPHLINCHAEVADALVLGLPHPQPTVLLRTVHNTREWATLPGLGRYVRWLHPWLYDGACGVSPQVMALLKRQAMPVAYMPNGLDAAAPPAAEALRATLNLPASAFIFGSVGRLETAKGYAGLLRAFAQCRAAGLDAHLVIIGEGTLRAALERDIQALQLMGRAHLVGGRPQAASFIRQFDVFVSSSLWEGMATVILEAMAAGVPVIGTAISGTVELIVSPQTGLLVPPGAVTALAQACQHLFQHPAERAQLAQAAQQQVRQFAFQPTVQKYAAFYRACLARAQRR